MVSLDDTDPDLLALLREAAGRWGALGVALTAVHLTDPAVVVATLTRADDAPGPTEEDVL